MSDELKALGHQPTPVLKAVRAYCIDCSGGNMAEVRKCTVTRCELYPFRMGKNPWRAKRELTDEQRKQMGERLKAARNA